MKCLTCPKEIELDRIESLAKLGKTPKYCIACWAVKFKAMKAKRSRMARDEVMRSLGMVKVKGNLGGTYYE